MEGAFCNILFRMVVKMNSIVKWIIPIIFLIVVISYISINVVIYNAVESLIIQSEHDMNRIQLALNEFYKTNSSYPIINKDIQFGDSICNNDIQSAYLIINLQNQIINLTTPISYMTTLPKDLYNLGDHKVCSYGYYSDGQNYYILTSWGPDRTDGIRGIEGGALDERLYTGAQFSDRDRAGIRGSAFLLSNFRFDPSNGINSTGDIIMIGP